MTLPSRVALLALACSLVPLVSCGDRPGGAATPGTLAGTVYVTAPVRGAVVSAYAFDLETGERGNLIAASEPTDDLGFFSIDMQSYAGDVLLETEGAAAQYVEPASGAEASFEASTVLRSILVDWENPGTSFRFGFEFAENRDDLAINPWTELAVAYADGLHQQDPSNGYRAAATLSLGRWHEHLEMEFWAVVPRSLVDDVVGPFNERVHAGVLATGLSQLARRIAVESSLSPAAVSSLSLVEALVTDLEDPGLQLDGCAKVTGCSSFEEHIRIGACPEPIAWDDVALTPICSLSGRTLRADWLESVAEFLDDDSNRSGLVFGDVRELMRRIAERDSDLFPPVLGGFDTEGPVITIEPIEPDDLQPTAIIEGVIRFRVTVTDAVEMPTGALGGVELIEFVRGDDRKVEGNAQGPVVSRDAPDPRTRVLEVEFDTNVFSDGPVNLLINAADAAENPNPATPLDWTLHVNNAPNGTVAGTVMLGGRVEGAEVVVIDYTGGTFGTELGSGITDEEGFFLITLDESPSTTSLLVQARKPEATDATYVEMSNGTTISLSTDDVVESVIADYIEGENRSIQVTPWTHIGTAFSRGLHATKYCCDGTGSPIPDLWDEAVADAFSLLEAHFADGGASILLRSVRPSDMTLADEVTTLNAQARYGLVVAALGQLADQHAEESFLSLGVLNTLTLTHLLAADLESDPFGEPLFDGGNAGGPGGAAVRLEHGLIEATSYFTRFNLSIAAVTFIETNERDASPFSETDILSLLDFMADDGFVPEGAPPHRLYPAADPPIGYDLIPPGPVTFDVPPTPIADTVLRGTINLQVRAEDDRALKAFVWMTPGITGAFLDSSAGPEGPWVLVGTLATDCSAEGDLELRARATDRATRFTDAVHNVIVDCTPPVIAVTNAIADGVSLAPGDVTGADTITIEGTVTDANELNLANTTYTWRAGPSTLLPVVDGAWSLTLPMEAGSNVLVLNAADTAGNASSPVSVTYIRDAEPPVVVKPTAAFAASVTDEDNLEASTTGAPDPAVSYTFSGAPDSRNVVDGVSFTKYTPRYLAPGNPDSENLPEWRFRVSDNTSTDADVVFEYRILYAGSPIVDWNTVPHADEGLYNRSFLTHGGLSPLILSETVFQFVIEFRATDEFGNTSAVESVFWNQFLKPPPLHLTAGNVTSQLNLDPERVPRGYALGNSPLLSGGGVNNAGVLVEGDVPTGTLRLAAWQVSNPNSVPVNFRPASMDIDARWSTQTRFSFNNIGNLSGILAGCMGNVTFPQNLAGTACHTPGTFGAVTNDANNTVGNIHNSIVEVYLVQPGGGLELLPACAERGRDNRGAAGHEKRWAGSGHVGATPPAAVDVNARARS